VSFLLALRNVLLRPWRSVFLLFGFSLGVAVMIVLLSIGEALLSQARNERLVGGGEITVLPQGIDIEVLKTGGLGGLFFSIDHARFVYRQMLAAPRLSSQVATVAPQIEGKLLYVSRAGDAAALPVMAIGEIPSRTRGVGAMPSLASGTWTDDSLDRRWYSPSPEQLRHEIDHFHLPPSRARGDSTWAEWHYFNVLSPDRKRWTFISFILGGQVPDGRWGGQVLVTTHEQGGRGGSRHYETSAPPANVRFSTTRADLDIGESTVRVRPDGNYDIHAVASEAATGDRITVDVVLQPAAGVYLPGGTASEDIVSGYVVPALRADATGTICVRSGCEQLTRVQAYHDHNWGRGKE